MKRSPPSLEDLLEPLYGSLLDAARFAEFAAGLQAALDSHLVALQTNDGTHRHRVHRHYSQAAPDVPDTPSSRDDSSINQYMLRGTEDLLRDGLINSARLFARNDLERTAFYQDVLVPLDVHHSAGVLLHSHGTELIGLSVSRSASRRPFDAHDESLLYRLLPHLQNVYRLQEKMQGANELVRGLDALPQAAWIVDGEQEVLYANAEAHRLLEQRTSCIRLRGPRLSASWNRDGPRLAQAIAEVIRGTQGRGAHLLLHSPAGHLEATCTLQPLLQGCFDGWVLPNRAAALLLLSRLDLAPGLPADILRDAYGLTQAEAMLAQALLRHGSLTACRGALGKSYETLRSQLKALFAKTDTHRQSDLLLKLRQLAVGTALATDSES